MSPETTPYERFVRLDQKVRLERARLILRFLDADTAAATQAAVEVAGLAADLELEDLIQERLEAMIAWEAQKDGRERAMSGALIRSHNVIADTHEAARAAWPT